MSKHTAEQEAKELVERYESAVRIRSHALHVGMTKPEHLDNQRRLEAEIVQRLSALAGIPDPAAFVERAKRIEEAAKLYIEGTHPKVGHAFHELRTALETNP